jgi:hypothetical protein
VKTFVFFVVKDLTTRNTKDTTKTGCMTTCLFHVTKLIIIYLVAKTNGKTFALAKTNIPCIFLSKLKQALWNIFLYFAANVVLWKGFTF